MPHLAPLIFDLCFILITAAAVTLLCKRLNQPVVLGYLIAGILVGPAVPLFPTVVDSSSLQIWAEMGVIFLLFGLGLEFSFKKLWSVGREAGFTALFEVLAMMAVGILTGTILGWSWMDSLFLGGILSISSTTIVIRALQESKKDTQEFLPLIYGILIFEDIAAILLLVLLSTLAATQEFSGIDLILKGVHLFLFVLICFVIGKYLVPRFFKANLEFLDDENRLIIALGACLLLVIAAVAAGFSAALGAFMMGSLFSETLEGKRIEKVIEPVKNLFGAIFFVSIGMLFDPKVLTENWALVIVLTIVTIIGKALSTFSGALISGASLRSSVHAGLSMAQIGEFSFIIATLGLSLKVISPVLSPLAVVISVITTFLTPYLLRLADPLLFRLQNSKTFAKTQGTESKT